MLPTISVVIPTYNYGRYVCEAVNCALSQTLKPMEIIVVDDGSTDDTRERLAHFGDRIRYVHQPNRGLSSARNTGIKTARGEYIAFLDSDDRWHPQKLERQWVARQHYPDVRAIGADNVPFTDQPPVVATTFSGEPAVQRISLRDLVYGVHFSGGSGALLHRDCLGRAGVFDESLRAVEDLDLWLRIAAHDGMGRLLEPLVFARWHRTSMSMQAASMEANHRRVIAKAFSSLPELRGKRWWKRVALARMHRNVSLMHRDTGHRANALASLGRSFLACPWTSGDGEPLLRLRIMAYTLRRGSLWL